MQAKSLSALFGALLLAHCSNEVTSPRQPPRDLSKAEAQVVAADNAFGLELMKSLNAGKRDQNVVVSPLSVSMALGMTLNGARGSTLDAMRSTLGFQGLSESQINDAYRGVIDMLRGLDPGVKFQIANSIWYRSGFQARQEFLDLNNRFFDARATGIDFSDPAAAGTINGWVDENTNGRIKSIVPDPVPADLVMYLINAIYFKGAWSTKFDPAKTRDGDFRRPDGSTVRVPMMNMHGAIRYAASERYSAVELPYGDRGFSMTVLLPAEGGSADDLLASLSADEWKELPSRFREEEIPLSLPKFTVEYGEMLNDVLKAMGMSVAFSGGADLSGIAGEPGDLYISDVRHKTYIEVNEEGTEAAAATSVGISRTSLGPSMIVNRPFIFAIRESHSGAVLFIGKVADPTKR